MSDLSPGARFIADLMKAAEAARAAGHPAHLIALYAEDFARDMRALAPTKEQTP